MERKWTQAQIKLETERILNEHTTRDYPVQIVSIAESMGLSVYSTTLCGEFGDKEKEKHISFRDNVSSQGRLIRKK